MDIADLLVVILGSQYMDKPKLGKLTNSVWRSCQEESSDLTTRFF